MKKETFRDQSGTSGNILVGIVSTEKEYKLAWEINLAWNVSFTQQKVIQSGNTIETPEFPVYSYHPDEYVSYSLVKNKYQNQVLFSKLKQFDFLILIIFGESDEYPELNAQELTLKLRKISSIQLATPVEDSKIMQQLFILLND